jgi:hypothetical protein
VRRRAKASAQSKKRLDSAFDVAADPIGVSAAHLARTAHLADVSRTRATGESSVHALLERGSGSRAHPNMWGREAYDAVFGLDQLSPKPSDPVPLAFEDFCGCLDRGGQFAILPVVRGDVGNWVIAASVQFYDVRVEISHRRPTIRSRRTLKSEDGRRRKHGEVATRVDVLATWLARRTTSSRRSRGNAETAVESSK